MGVSRGVYRVLVGKPEGKSSLGDPGICGGIILKLTFRKWDGVMDCIDLSQNRDKWRTIVKAAMNLRVP